MHTLDKCLLLPVSRPIVHELLQENLALLERIASLIEARKAELESLDKEQPEAQSNLLVETMKTLFLAVRDS